MIAPFSWLKDYVEIDISAEQLQEKLFSCGFEVEELTYLGKDVTNVVVGKILSTEKHPDADRLTVCKVDCGEHGVRLRRARRQADLHGGDQRLRGGKGALRARRRDRPA